MNKKLSVIIPTIQKKTKVLNKLIEVISKDDCVDEILIINNLTFLPLDFNENSKVKVYTPNENLYVNKSWNIGVSLIRNDNFCLMNDDMIPCYDFCSLIINSNEFNAEDTGFIGMNPEFIKQYNKEIAEELEVPAGNNNSCPEITILEQYLKVGDWGISIFSKKQNWFDIPEQLKIIYGDNYLLYKSLCSGKKNYKISNIPVNHIHSSSSGAAEFSQIIKRDIVNSLNFVPN